ncbi:hypothetical protein VP01_784g2 [Puccinia sorghi]|uniref:Uncharacterized protein n=1 Tax=Puccinia sorghi TaxID=27349 RepID=A0A0L6UB10_9BASI|nr:hypothetical protein VP01_784g2 [Puccinia sorghi]
MNDSRQNQNFLKIFSEKFTDAKYPNPHYSCTSDGPQNLIFPHGPTWGPPMCLSIHCEHIFGDFGVFRLHVYNEKAIDQAIGLTNHHESILMGFYRRFLQLFFGSQPCPPPKKKKVKQILLCYVGLWQPLNLPHGNLGFTTLLIIRLGFIVSSVLYRLFSLLFSSLLSFYPLLLSLSLSLSLSLFLSSPIVVFLFLLPPLEILISFPASSSQNSPPFTPHVSVLRSLRACPAFLRKCSFFVNHKELPVWFIISYTCSSTYAVSQTASVDLLCFFFFLFFFFFFLESCQHLLTSCLYANRDRNKNIFHIFRNIQREVFNGKKTSLTEHSEIGNHAENDSCCHVRRKKGFLATTGVLYINGQQEKIKIKK